MSSCLVSDFLFDCQSLNDSNKLFVQGCLSCVREMLPSFVKFVRDPHSNNSKSETEKLLQVRRPPSGNC